MSDERPEPLVPPDVDLSKLDGFMLDTRKLLSSELVALSTGEEFKAAVLLWCRAWQQPRCSLPHDDRVLASFAGVAPTRWRKIKEMAMRGFVQCSDGRWYHRVLAEDAKRASAALVKRRERTQAATEARKNSPQPARHVDRNDAPNEQRNGAASSPRDEERNVARNDLPTVARDGTGQDRKEEKKEPLSEVPKKAEASALPSRPDGMPPIPEMLARLPTRGSRLPPEFAVPPEWLLEANAIRREHGMPDIDPDLEARKFVDYWRAKSGAAATKLDWHATWRNWVRNVQAPSRLAAKPSPRAGIDAAFAKLEQLGPVNLDAELLAAERRCRQAGETS